MAQFVGVDHAMYAHSQVHAAVAQQDHAALRRILSTLPQPVRPGEVSTESQSLEAEQQADDVSKVIDRRDVPGRETPLHVAVRLGDGDAVEMLMSAGADWSLQNEQGWSALQEAVCAREEEIAVIITRHYQPMAWAKWCRRLPRLAATMQRMRDFYMEITFHFESSVIPFIGRIAPSDTYRIWKQGSNLRADMTLAGFDGFRIHRSDQSFLFLGNGSEDGKLAPGTLCVLTHKDKEVSNALEGAGVQPSEAEIMQEVTAMSRTNMYRPGIDVTQAELIAQTTWRRQEKTEMVGAWKAKIYDMHNVQVSVRSRRVPGAMTDKELFAAESERQEVEAEEDYSNLLTAEEKKQLDSVLKSDTVDNADEGLDGVGQPEQGIQSGSYDNWTEEYDLGFPDDDSDLRQMPSQNGSREPPGFTKEEKKGRWFGWGRKSLTHNNAKKQVVESNELLSDKGSEASGSSIETFRKTKQSPGHNNSNSSHNNSSHKELLKSKARRSMVRPEATSESEYKKGLRPILWLTQDFPLKTEELLPLLDILANKVKAVRRLQELLTTKLPSGTFPVKVAIPVVPTIRVVITFTKFAELKPSEEFSTPISSPTHFQDAKVDADVPTTATNGSWLYWISGSQNLTKGGAPNGLEEQLDEEADPFLIPSDYLWIDMEEKKRRLLEKKGKSKKEKKPPMYPKGGLESDMESL
ncbi:unnamed protein product [Sphagnum troendelagicum]|uniref:Ankyrin repeat domain-containing protein n=1 Tax=Sphagnum troendelagicum TaxID=128251 RepID=A0ABP0TC77_9BRYO